MINFVVVDDNDGHRKRICNAVMKRMMSNQINFKINEYSDNTKELT